MNKALIDTLLDEYDDCCRDYLNRYSYSESDEADYWVRYYSRKLEQIKQARKSLLIKE